MGDTFDVLQPTTRGGTVPAITSALDFIEASRSEATRRAYRADWADFTAWCRRNRLISLPAESATVASYLADLAKDRKVATIQRRLAAINGAHRLAGARSPVVGEEVRLVLQGIRRTKGVAPSQVRPVTLKILADMVRCLPEGLVGERDRALLLVGWAGAFRRSELVALDVADLEFTEEGLVVTIRRSKTDQEGTGRRVGIPFGSSALCPVTAVKAWLESSGIGSGPVFRRVDRRDHVGARALNPASVAEVVKRTAELAGLDRDSYSGHSLRSGLATAAAASGATETAIMAQTGHKSTAMVRRYIRHGSLFRQNAASLAGL